MRKLPRFVNTVQPGLARAGQMAFLARRIASHDLVDATLVFSVMSRKICVGPSTGSGRNHLNYEAVREGGRGTLHTRSGEPYSTGRNEACAGRRRGDRPATLAAGMTGMHK